MNLISSVLYLLVLLILLILVPILITLQAINFIITSIQYIFVYKKYKNIQELFTENSEYLRILFNN